jgi:hypothetical protein
MHDMGEMLRSAEAENERLRKRIEVIFLALLECRKTHSEDCDVNDQNLEGIRKPCNCFQVRK